MAEEATSETHLPAERAETGEAPRLPASDVHPGGPGDRPQSSSQGSRPALGVTWRIRDRATFVELRQRGIRFRHGSLSVLHAFGTIDDPPRFGYAVGRRVGTAVVRNRLRRRLRATVAGVVSSSAERPPPGAYLVTVAPSAVPLSADALRAEVAAVLRQVSRRAVERSVVR